MEKGMAAHTDTGLPFNVLPARRRVR